MGTERSVVDVKANLSACVRQAEAGEPVVITRHGRPVAALVCASDLEQIRRLRDAGPEGGLAGIAGGWPGSDELVALLAPDQRTAARSAPSLE